VGSVAFWVNAFEFERAPGRFHGGIVVTVGPATHAGDGTGFGEGGAVGFARVLAASVGMDDQAGRGSALMQSHVQGV